MAKLKNDPIAEARRQWEAHGWIEAAPGMSAVTTILRVSQLLSAQVEVSLTPLGLSFARFEILRLLGFSRLGALPMGKIGDRLQVHPASVTSAVKRLEADGLVQRYGHGDDGRVIMAAILDEGRKLLVPATEKVNAVFISLGLDRSQTEEVIELLNRIRAFAGDPINPQS